MLSPNTLTSEKLSSRFDLSERVAVVTGGAGLLGRQFVRTLLEAGAKVVIADIHEEKASIAARAEAKESGRDVIGLCVDVSRKDDVERLASSVVERWGQIDILVNNAGIDPKLDVDVAQQQAITFEEYPLELWQQSIAVNLTGPFLCSQAFGKMMRRQARGVIVNICSTYGLVAPDQRLYQRDDEPEQTIFKPASYAVAKAGLAQLTRYLAAYWGAHNIRVNSLSPHGVANMQDEQFRRRYGQRCPLGRMAQPDEMNGALLFLASDASSYMTGSNLVVDGGWTAW